MNFAGEAGSARESCEQSAVKFGCFISSGVDGHFAAAEMAEGSSTASTATGMTLKIGSRVEVVAKQLLGTVQFIGETEFSPGKWIGVVLDEPRGKNNGIINGKEYFKAPENRGLFVRQNQLRIVTDKRDSTSSSSIPRAPSFHSSNSSIASSKSTQEAMTTSVPAPSGLKPPSKRISTQNQSIVSSSTAASAIPSTPTQPPLVKTQPSVSLPSPTTESPLVNELQAQVKDLQEKLETLIMKRSEDRAKLKEYEKCKIQLEYLENFKKQVTESQSSLQKQLAMAKREAKEAVEALAKRESEVRELEETAEMATLDKEMAEEKYESLQREMEQLKERLEEVTIEFEIMKSELDSRETPAGADGQPVTSYQIKQLESKNEKLTEALLKLRDLALSDKEELKKVQKELTSSRTECDELRKTKEKLQHEVVSFEEQISDLKEQVDSALGSHRMVEILTEKNLELEEKLDKLMEDQEILEKLLDANEQLLEEEKSCEQELIQERDMLQGTINKMIHDNEATKSVVKDYETTITKFRDLVANLRKENEQLKAARVESINAHEKELASKFEHDQENIEYKIRLKEQKIKDLEEQLVKANEKHLSYDEQLVSKNEEITRLNKSIEGLKFNMEEKEAQVSNLKKALKAKIDELSEAVIRRDLAEKKLSNAFKDSDEKGTQLQEQVEKLQGQLEAKKKEYEETLTHLQADVDRAEAQTVELKRQLKLISNHGKGSPRIASASLAGDSPHLARSDNLSSVFSSPSMSTGSCQPGSPLEESYLQQINSLRRVISLLKHENASLLMQANLKKVALQGSLHRQGSKQLTGPKMEQITRLRKEISSLERKSASLLLSLRVNQISAKEKRHLGLESAQLNLQLTQLRSQLNHLLDPLCKGVDASGEIWARLTVPSIDAKEQAAQVVPVDLSLSQLMKLHQSLL